MLRNTHDLTGATVRASDGDVGDVQDFYFDDEAWVIRYLVVDTGSWLNSRQVLVSPMLCSLPDWQQRTLAVERTREQIRSGPDIDTRRPVSRQQEADYMAYYNTPAYWGGDGLWGSAMTPDLLPGYDAGYVPRDGPPHMPQEAYGRNLGLWSPDEDPHLRSCKAVTGHRIEAADGDIGHVDGFLLDDRTWAIRYMIINTSNWWLGHQVLIAPTWIDAVDWPSQSVMVSLTRQAIQAAPAYNPLVQPERAEELRLYQHYGRQDTLPRSGSPSVDGIRMPAAPAGPGELL